MMLRRRLSRRSGGRGDVSGSLVLDLRPPNLVGSFMKADNLKRKEFELPSMMTEALTHYVHMRSELSEFSTSYHKIAFRALHRDDGSRDLDIYKTYRGNAVFFLEHFAVRVSDLFDVYIEELVFMIASNTLGFFDEKDERRARTQLAKLGIQPDPFEIKIEASASMARRNKDEICEHIERKIGINISTVSSWWDDAITFNKVRNLIVHKSSEIDARFIAYAKGKNLPFSSELRSQLNLTERWVTETAMKINECVYAIDEFVGDSLGVFKRPRDGHFWLSRSHTSNPFSS